MNLTKRDAAAVALAAVSLASVAGAVTVPARAAASVEQAVTARDAATTQRDQAVQAADGDYRQAQAVADAAHDRAVAAARGDRESEYQAAVRDRDAAAADLEKVKVPSRESVRERGDEYAEACSSLEKNASLSAVVDLSAHWREAGVDTADEGRCREAGDERIAADLTKAKEDATKRRKALAAVRDENAKTVAAIDKAAAPATEQASQTRGQALADAQAQRDAAVQAAENNAAPVIASAGEDIDAGQSSHTGRMIALWVAAVAALAGAVWLGRARLAQVPVRRAGGALTAAAVWLVQGWARAATWAVQQRRGGRLGRAFESATVSGLQAGAFAPAELLKGSAMSHGWDTRKPRKAVSGVRIAVLLSVLTMAGMAIATHFGAPAEGTVAETGLASFSYFLAHLVPLSWVVFGGPAVAVAAAGVGHALPLDAPMPVPAVPVAGAAQPIDVDPHADTLARSLKDSDRRAWGHLLTPAVVVPIDGGHQYTWKLPAGLPASQVDQARLMSHASALGEHPRLVQCSGQRVVIDVLNVDPDNMPPTAWPAPARSNFRDPFPVGKTSSGLPVAVALAGARVAVIAKSGHGKSYLARSIATWAAQDPNVDLRVADLKGDAKLAPLRQCASAWASAGDREAAWDMICAVGEEVDRRNVWSGSDPEGREAIDHFGPLVLFVDEVDRVVGTRAQKALGDIAERGRSAGITMVVATRQTDTKSVPTNVLNACETKFVGRFDKGSFVWSMMGVPADVDLSALRRGEWAVADLAWSGWRTVRSYLLDDDDARERLAAAAEVRARHMPVVAQDVPPEPAEEADPDPLVDLLTTMGDRSGMTWAEVADELGEEAVEEVRKVTGSGKFRRGEATLRGVRRRDLKAAVDAGT